MGHPRQIQRSSPLSPDNACLARPAGLWTAPVVSGGPAGGGVQKNRGGRRGKQVYTPPPARGHDRVWFPGFERRRRLPARMLPSSFPTNQEGRESCLGQGSLRGGWLATSSLLETASLAAGSRSSLPATPPCNPRTMRCTAFRLHERVPQCILPEATPPTGPPLRKTTVISCPLNRTGAIVFSPVDYDYYQVSPRSIFSTKAPPRMLFASQRSPSSTGLPGPNLVTPG